MKSNIEIIKDLYKFFSEKNGSEIKRLFDDKIKWNQMAGFPNGGQYIGFEDIRKNVFQGFSENWTAWKAVVREYIDAGDSVFAVGHYEGIYNQTGNKLKAEFIHRYQLKSQKITRFDQYTDTLLVAKAMGL